MRDILQDPKPNHLIANSPPSQVTVLKELTEVLTNTADTAIPQPKETPITEPLNLPKKVRFSDDTATEPARPTRRSHTKFPPQETTTSPLRVEFWIETQNAIGFPCTKRTSVFCMKKSTT